MHGYAEGPVTTYRAGEIIPIRFWNFEIKDYMKFPPPRSLAQARHGGGACEFSLSYDGGKTWKFYHHCANIIVNGDKDGHLPELDMTVVNVAQRHRKINVHAKGDQRSDRSSGPNRRERILNTNGFYAYGGQAGKHGIDLGLVGT
ncbi:hypothetical protein BGZ54_008392 [Gamsiella multidivaricata]|nr:hypothetical protein BGZ54_008392 [Gamsiella multidivaricata]